MKLTTLLLSAAVSALPGLLRAQIAEPPAGYRLVWSDEFNGSALDEKAWNIEVNGDGGGNQELQFYRRENVAVADGNLVITARRENYSNRSFTSGRVNSRKKAAFRHGIIQARIKFPRTANGLWPAYWMMGNDYSEVGWPRCGEMDIVEMGHFNGMANGTQDRYFAGTLHFGKSASNEDHQMISQDYMAPEANPVGNDGYHIITVEWDDNNLYMYYDLPGYGAAQRRSSRYFSTSVAASGEVNAAGTYFQKPFFFIFNLAVGGSYTNIYSPAGITALPQAGDEARMYVDWVRVYQADADANAQYVTPQGSNLPSTPTEPTPAEPDSLTEMGLYGSAAIGENGVSTFDFAHSTDAVLIGTSGGVTDAFSASTVANYNVDEVNNFLYIWSDTYSALPSEGVNSFGFEEGYSHYRVNSVGWSGLGYASAAGHGKDLSMVDDDYVLHFAMRGTDADVHASHQVMVGKAKFSLGTAPVEGAPVLGDFRRDGSWTAFDIPVTVLKALAGGNLFDSDGGPKAYVGNVFALLSGGKAGTDLQFDNVFFYKNPNVNKALPHTDTTTKIGPYGRKAVVDGQPTFNLSDAEGVVLIGTSAGVTEALSGKTLKNYNVDNQTHFFWVWDGGDYVGMPTDGTNSFGWPEGWTRLQVAGTSTWNGAGYASSGTGKDLSMIDDSYYLHFAMKGSDVLTHASQTVTVGGAVFVIGRATTGAQILGDYRRDGEWYGFDIPVARLRQMAGGTLFADAARFVGNVFAVSTTPGAGAEVNFDNVFFYKPASGTGGVEIPTYVSAALDEQGGTTFDIGGARDVVLIGTSTGVTEGFNGNIRADYNVDDVTHYLYVWDGTYTGDHLAGANSFGYDEGYTVYTVGGAGWSGLGYASQGRGKDLSMLDDSYFLHFAMAGTGTETHLLTVGNAKFAIGPSGYNDNGTVIPALADYPRDGRWYSFDIPFSEISSRATTVFDGAKGYTGNVFAVLSGGKAGTKLQFDNVFFYRTTATGVAGLPSADLRDGAGVRWQEAYDLGGRRVNGLTRKGVYIVRTAKGMRKVLVK